MLVWVLVACFMSCVKQVALTLSPLISWLESQFKEKRKCPESPSQRWCHCAILSGIPLLTDNVCIEELADLKMCVTTYAIQENMTLVFLSELERRIKMSS